MAALREMRRDPPPRGMEVLPKDYKVPYSHYHEDPPEVRLAADKGHPADLHTAHHPTSLTDEAAAEDREDSLSGNLSCGGPAPCS